MDFLQAFDRDEGAIEVVFERLGITTDFQRLNGGELAECFEMGGFRGMSYGLYLAGTQLREAAGELMEQGKIFEPLEVMNILSYKDVAAVWRALCHISGGDKSRVSIKGKGVELPSDLLDSLDVMEDGGILPPVSVDDGVGIYPKYEVGARELMAMGGGERPMDMGEHYEGERAGGEFFGGGKITRGEAGRPQAPAYGFFTQNGIDYEDIARYVATRISDNARVI